MIDDFVVFEQRSLTQPNLLDQISEDERGRQHEFGYPSIAHHIEAPICQNLDNFADVSGH